MEALLFLRVMKPGRPPKSNVVVLVHGCGVETSVIGSKRYPGC